MTKRRLARIATIAGGGLLFAQAFIHSFLGYASIVAISSSVSKNAMAVLLWAWFSVGFALVMFALIAVYASSGFAHGKRWALMVASFVGIAALAILVTPAIIG